MSLTPIKALTFDVFGTLVDWRSSVSAQLQEFFMQAPDAVHLPPDIDWDAVALDWRGHYQPSMQAVRSGERSFVILDELHRESLVSTLEQHDIRGLTASQLDALTLCWHRLDAWPDVVAGLRQLRPHYALAALSNGNTALLKNLSHYSDLCWHVSLGAEPAQSYKPQARAYLHSAALLAVEPEQCMMVAAHNSDLHAARALGFKTAYINRPDEYGSRQSGDTGPESDWDLVAETLTELAGKLTGSFTENDTSKTG